MQHQRGETTLLDVPKEFPSIFPRKAVVASLASALAGTEPVHRTASFALVMTDYFGGAGAQWACAFIEGHRTADVRDINAALRVLGVRAANDLDEFDTLGLASHRRTPHHFDRYADLCDELGL